MDLETIGTAVVIAAAVGAVAVWALRSLIRQLLHDEFRNGEDTPASHRLDGIEDKLDRVLRLLGRHSHDKDGNVLAPIEGDD